MVTLERRKRIRRKSSHELGGLVGLVGFPGSEKERSSAEDSVSLCT